MRLVALVLALVYCVYCVDYCFPELSRTPSFDCSDLSQYKFSEFNTIIFDSLTALDGGDIQGRLLVFGDAKIGAFSIGDQVIDITKTYSAVFGSDVSWESGSIYPSNARILVQGEFTAPPDLVGRMVNGTNIPSCSNQLYEYYLSVSKGFAQYPGNTIIQSQPSGLIITGQSRDLLRYFVSVTAEQWSDARWFSLANTNVLSEFIVNIPEGESPVTFSGAEFPTVPQNTIYNIPGSRDIYIDTIVSGSIIAPDARIHQTSGIIQGWVVARSATINEVDQMDCTCICP
eukprot:TRINITY_DN5543_c0_g1_i4.p1 TRINITY_DN5543_c0_g1~~TRINITY_DN5543_c0_g1_i4.p1  ORF type:complete len:287 (+),score=58.48 TRINITY_DN5543_c0_g1_i4:58-918(+)